jgi:hypothetical protein
MEKCAQQFADRCLPLDDHNQTMFAQHISNVKTHWKRVPTEVMLQYDLAIREAVATEGMDWTLAISDKSEFWITLIAPALMRNSALPPVLAAAQGAGGFVPVTSVLSLCEKFGNVYGPGCPHIAGFKHEPFGLKCTLGSHLCPTCGGVGDFDKWCTLCHGMLTRELAAAEKASKQARPKAAVPHLRINTGSGRGGYGGSSHNSGGGHGGGGGYSNSAHHSNKARDDSRSRNERGGDRRSGGGGGNNKSKRQDRSSRSPPREGGGSPPGKRGKAS